MNIKIFNDYNEMSDESARIIENLINEKNDAILGLATGSTPIGTYKKLVSDYNNGKVDFKNVSSFNLDEYYPIKKTDKQSYQYFMNKNFFDHINIDKNNVHIPSGEAENPLDECKIYDQMIEKSKGIDLQILGVGINGHIGFNEPSNSLISATHLAELTKSTIDANSRFFNSIDEVPKFALTMGMKNIFSAKCILLLISGKAKHEALLSLLDDKINTDVPVSLLKLHPNVIVLCDREAFYG